MGEGSKMTGVASFRLNIGDVIAAIHLPAAIAAPPLMARYGPFLSEAEAHWRVTLRLDERIPPHAPAWVTHEGATTRFQVMGHQGIIDLATQEAQISTPTPDLAHSALVRTLSFICMQALPRRGDGLLLHGAGIVLGGEGHIFFGASGRGKSTVARLARGQGEVLSDETVLVRWQAGQIWLESTPFWGLSTPQEQIQQVQPRRVPLRALYELTHAAEFALHRLSPGQAVMALLTSEKVATERASSAAAWLQMAERLVAQRPLYRLAFRPTVELWPFLAQHPLSKEAS